MTLFHKHGAKLFRCKVRTISVFGYLLVLIGEDSASAQQVNGNLGSPSATTTINGKQLPAPDPKFGGVQT